MSNKPSNKARLQRHIEEQETLLKQRMFLINKLLGYLITGKKIIITPGHVTVTVSLMEEESDPLEWSAKRGEDETLTISVRRIPPYTEQITLLS